VGEGISQFNTTMSFNLRYSTEADDNNAWHHRKNDVAAPLVLQCSMCLRPGSVRLNRLIGTFLI